MVQTFRNAWKIPELRRKILFTLFIVLLYRLGNAVPVPYVDTNILATYFAQLKNTVLGLYNTMSGGAFSLATIFALSIQPYINASIIIQLLCIAIPALERLSKEGGEEGKKKIAAITRYSTVGIGLVQGYGYYLLMSRNGIIVSDAPAVWAAIVIVMTFTAGSALVMWLGEQITEFGIGNGISIILFASIVSRFPQGLGSLVSKAINHDLSWVATILMLIGALAMIVMIVIVNDAERRIPVQYAKRVVGRKMYGGQATYLPMKVNMSGVLPIIFAQSIASLPPTIILLCGASYHVRVNPPKQDGVCDACGTALIVRPDDAPETVRDRLHVYHEQTEPLKGFYEKLGLLHSVENVGSIEDVSREIFRSLGIVE